MKAFIHPLRGFTHAQTLVSALHSLLVDFPFLTSMVSPKHDLRRAHRADHSGQGRPIHSLIRTQKRTWAGKVTSR